MTDQEINEAVARKLGWTKNIPKVPCEDPTCEIWTRNDPEAYMDSLPDYCHSIEAAWEILTSLKCDWEIKTTKYGIDIRIYDEAGQYPSAVSATAPMAICLAFLKLK